MLKIVFLDSATLGPDADLSSLEALGHLKLYPVSEASEIPERVRDADVIITNKCQINADVIDSARQLKLICAAATGLDNFDVAYAQKKGIPVKNVVGYSTQSVAQHTFALAFELLHSNRYFSDYVKSGRWSRSRLFTHLEKSYGELSSKKWGIIGLGEIGRKVAAIASAFGAEVAYASTSGVKREEAYPCKELSALLGESDIVSIHAPLNANTYHLLNEKTLSYLKEDAILLNLGRGDILDEEALVRVFEKTDLRVGLDVTSLEPLPEEAALNRILDSERLIITPHIAWASQEARLRLVEAIAQHIKLFFEER